MQLMTTDAGLNSSLSMQELAHRQQFFFWKNYRNNRLKHILPRPLPEPPGAVAPVPSPVPLPASSAATAAPVTTQAASPMQFVGAPGASLPKIDMKNSGVDRRKRKYAPLIDFFLLQKKKFINEKNILLELRSGRFSYVIVYGGYIHVRDGIFSRID